MAQDNTKLCDFTNSNNNDFLSTPIAPLTEAESCEINAALLNLVMKDQFTGLPSEDAATHLNNFVICVICKRRKIRITILSNRSYFRFHLEIVLKFGFRLCQK